jgi:hypothetical protein
VAAVLALKTKSAGPCPEAKVCTDSTAKKYSDKIVLGHDDQSLELVARSSEHRQVNLHNQRRRA